MKLVGPVLGDHGGHRAYGVAVLGRDVFRVHAEFLNGVLRGLGVRAAAQAVVRDAVNLVTVHIDPRTVDHRGKAAVPRLADQARSVDRARGELDHLKDVASVEGQVRHLTGGHELRHAGGFGVYRRGLAFNRHLLSHCAHLEVKINPLGESHGQLHVLVHQGSESAGFGLQRIIARLQVSDRIDAVPARLARNRDIGPFVSDRDGGAGNRGPARVGHGPRECAGGDLPPGGRQRPAHQRQRCHENLATHPGF